MIGDLDISQWNDIDAPVQVGFAGVVYLAARESFGFDVRGMGVNCDDLWWQCSKRLKAQKWVVPTKQYANLPCCEDDNAMTRDPALRAQREAFYATLYTRHYAATKGHLPHAYG